MRICHLRDRHMWQDNIKADRSLFIWFGCTYTELNCEMIMGDKLRRALEKAVVAHFKAAFHHVAWEDTTVHLLLLLRGGIAQASQAPRPFLIYCASLSDFKSFLNRSPELCVSNQQTHLVAKQEKIWRINGHWILPAKHLFDARSSLTCP
jgi:hypothetical protein